MIWQRFTLNLAFKLTLSQPESPWSLAAGSAANMCFQWRQRLSNQGSYTRWSKFHVTTRAFESHFTAVKPYIYIYTHHGAGITLVERCVGSGKDLAQRNDGSQHLDITQIDGLQHSATASRAMGEACSLQRGWWSQLKTLRLRDLHCKETNNEFVGLANWLQSTDLLQRPWIIEEKRFDSWQILCFAPFMRVGVVPDSSPEGECDTMQWNLVWETGFWILNWLNPQRNFCHWIHDSEFLLLCISGSCPSRWACGEGLWVEEEDRV